MIDLEKLSESAVELVFDTVPTAVRLGSYIKNVTGQGSEDYDAKNDRAALPARTIRNVRMLRVAASQEELVGTSITVDDVKIIIPAKDLPKLTPGTEDTLVMESVHYDVIKIKPLPVKTLHILFCRKK